MFGEETAEAARARFTGAVNGVLERFQRESVVVVAHGTVICLFVAAATGQAPLDLWLRLGLPAFVVLERPGLRLEAIVESVE